MSSTSKRGRKRNDDLPPNRARDVQRAFRARRAAHLDALQDRVDVLEAENTQLRQLLHMPSPDREPLGRGPTGKDKPASRHFGSPTMSSGTSEHSSSSRSPDDQSRSASPDPSQLWANGSSSRLPGPVGTGIQQWTPALDHASVDFSSSPFYMQQLPGSQQQPLDQFSPSFFGNPAAGGHGQQPTYHQQAVYPTSISPSSSQANAFGHAYQNHLNSSPAPQILSGGANPQVATLVRASQRRPGTPQHQQHPLNGTMPYHSQQPQISRQ
ncbi:hypothetical protein BKA62DRAFT_765843 [Auriculariales sp. MPI-PUGE-AT-0066]|nr:hypothetical protein BKA62DRAFT_765843 [Auriculariales sp. MPI-PUGE-AT-0066]